MKYILDNEGKTYRKFFEDICSIPHDSYKETDIANYIVEFAKERNLWWYTDDIWNVVIKKPASPGYEDHPPIMLQAHTDMVCVKTEGSDFNFDTDPLQLYVEDGWLKAKDTTLGADCGHGVAYMLAVLDDDTLLHPPLECFFSVQEECGIGGPKHIDYSLFTAKRLINLDVMDEGATIVSTTSVRGGDFIKNVKLISNDKKTLRLVIGGGVGGHAAMDIGKEHANAIKLCARILYSVLKEMKINLISVNGGTIRNNIPNSCETVFACNPNDYELLKKIVSQVTSDLKAEYLGPDPNIYFALDVVETAEKALDDFSTRNVIELLLLLPSGAVTRRFMSNGLALIVKKGLGDDGLVITSRNLGTVCLEGETLTIGYMFRSIWNSQLADMIDQTLLITDRYGAVFKQIYDYAGFTNSEDDPLNSLWKQVYREATGKDLIVNAIHGGTDVGTIVANIKGMDVMTLGPDTTNVHRSGEALNIESFDRTYEYLKAILSRL